MKRRNAHERMLETMTIRRVLSESGTKWLEGKWRRNGKAVNHFLKGLNSALSVSRDRGGEWNASSECLIPETVGIRRYSANWARVPLSLSWLSLLLDDVYSAAVSLLFFDFGSLLVTWVGRALLSLYTDLLPLFSCRSRTWVMKHMANHCSLDIRRWYLC